MDSGSNADYLCNYLICMLNEKLQDQQDKYTSSYKSKLRGAKDFRIDVIAKLIIDGVRPFEISKFCAEKFGYSTRNAEKYMKLARERLNEINKPNLEENLAVAITQINELIQEAKKEKPEDGRYNRREILDYIMAKARLQRLLDPKMEIKGNIGFSINGKSIEQLADEMASENLQQETDTSGNNSQES